MQFRFLVLFSLISCILQGAPVKTLIKGELPNAAGKIIRLYEYSNGISYSSVKISSDSITQNGTFSFELIFEKGDVKTVFFAVERYKSYDFFVEAGNSYILLFDSIDFSLQDEYYSPLAADFPPLNFQIIEPINDLNSLVSVLLDEFAMFSARDFPEIVQKRDKKKLELFRIRLDSLFSQEKNVFFRNFVEYSFAELELTAQTVHLRGLVEKYLNNRPFLYDHPAFMNFFNLCFDKYIFLTSRKIPFSDLEKNIVSNPDYFALLDSLGKDTLLKNEVVRDMVLIKNLHQMYFAGVLDRELIYSMMNVISETSKFFRHRKIALSLLPGMNVHLKLLKAPDLTARTSDGDFFSLDTLKGKYTYMMFFTTYCKACYPEMVVLGNLYPKYNSLVNFVGISMDVNFLKFYYFMQDYQYPWYFANFYKNFDIEENWGISVYPQAFMLDPDGNILNGNAPLPSEFLEDYLKGIVIQKNK